MDIQAYQDLIRQNNDLRAEINELRARDSLDFMTASLGWQDEFGGDSLDTRWNVTLVGTGVAPAIQATSPSRALFSTAATINSVSQLDENALYKWSVTDRFTMVTRALVNSNASVSASLCRVARVIGTDGVGILFDSSINAGNFILSSTAAGVSTTSAIQAADTALHIFAISVTPTYVRGRIDGGPIVEILTNIPTVDMQLTLRIQNLAAADKRMEMDRVIIKPGVNLF